MVAGQLGLMLDLDLQAQQEDYYNRAHIQLVLKKFNCKYMIIAVTYVSEVDEDG